jgi:polyisoprenyl-teichoic acid--peptidoglycan teichoic acid transferase
LIWVLVVVSSWAVHKPDQMRTGQRMLATAVVAILSIGVAAPFAVGARTAYVQIDLLRSIFDNPEPSRDVAMQPPTVRTQPSGFGPATGYFANKPRVNVLLLGGDGGTDRIGIRTDTMILASIDTRTGRTVLISLPRNFSKVQFPTGTEMARRFPDGFNDLMNAVYTYAENDKSVVPGAKYPGGELIKQTFAWTIAQPVDYFVLVNLDGFRDIVDAFGGVTLTVDRRLPIGGSHDANGHVLTYPTGYITPGHHKKLGGFQALWYARSRFSSDDYDRMRRQRCMVGALVDQANPVKLLKKYPQIAKVAKNNIATDIPRQDLPAWVTLVERMQGGELTSLPFTSSVVNTTHPDFVKIQSLVQKAIRASQRTTTSTTTSATSPTTTTTTTGSPTSTGKSTTTSKTQDVSSVC